MSENNLPLTTEMRLREKTGEEATVKDLPVSVMQALYHEITGRTETLERVFNDDYVFSHEDIIQGVLRLVQATQQYNVNAADAQFTIKFTSGERQTFTSLEKFKQIDINRPQVVSSCIVTISFLLATPGVGKFQNYRINFTLRSAAENSKQAINWGIHPYASDFCAKLEIEYVDFIIAQSIVAVFDTWLATLEKTIIKKQPKWVERIEEDLDLSLAASGFCATLLLSYGILVANFKGQALSSLSTVGLLYGSISAAVIVAVALKIFSSSYGYWMWPSGMFPFISITRGDKQYIDKVLTKDAGVYKNARRAMASVIIGIVSSLIAGFIATYFGLTG